ncbi:holo-ACP synthase [Nesterenkonia sp. MY13]|uniref:Holo-[acyl-carrier-protein] synthase n=1 Tax=Nesterenkonia sedimenti TaxID=1463632 RepID=A0A7X8YDF3_9MICC|nr:holo-ACP synthase [Nesterenkonia sedimenti]NLS09097.1 holo-ACP synthase [Nesterenkonia sedimenti]
MIIGIGVDVVDVPRFAQQLERTPGLTKRLFTPAERELKLRSLAARFAAKEAVAKALGAPAGMNFQDCEVVCEPSGNPHIEVSGTVAEAAAARGIRTWHLSLSHDGDIATAMVIAEG